MTIPRNLRTGRLRRGVMSIAATAVLLASCSSDSDSTSTDVAAVTADSISIELARATIPAAGDTTMPVYGIVVNDSVDVMRVISATSPAADSIDLLSPEDSIVLPAEGSVVQPDGGLIMEPVGFKLLLNGIDPDAIESEVEVTLRFENGESFAFSAALQEVDQ